ncbi:hypothetical protein [Trueperella pyogenes]
MKARLEIARRQLEELIVWREDFAERLAVVLGMKGSPTELAPAAHATRSPVETALVRAQQLGAIGEAVEDIAAEWGFDASQHAGDIRLAAFVYVYGRLAWACRHFPMVDAFDAISKAHAAAVDGRPSPYNRICPAHPESMTLLAESPGGDLYCSECSRTFTIEEVNGLGLLHLVGANPPVKIATAAELLNLEAGTIRQWVRRGHIEGHYGVVYLGEVYDCAQRDTPGLSR